MYNHGVEYSPYTISLTPPPTLEELKKDGIKFIRIQWVDLVNYTRFRVVPISYFEKLLKSSRPGVGVVKACLGLVYLNMAQGFTPIGEYLYVPDLKTLKICPYAPGHASVMGRFEEKTPTPGPDGNLSTLVDLCPRTLLDRIVKEAKTISNVDFLVGFESEFILLKSTQPIDAVNYHNWTASEGLPSGKIETVVLEEIADAVQASGIELQMYHPEAAPGQYEIITGPLPPLEAADALVHTREIIRNIAFKHGLRATFAPRLYMTSAGSSAHTNISVHSATQGPKPVEGLSALESSFLAGVLAHLPAMPAVTLPIPASYKRMVDGVWSGGTYVCWGAENRESPIRLTNATSPTSRRFEMRFVDGTANPYLVLATILAAGHEGIRTQQQLTIQNNTGSVTAAQMKEEERAKLGITARLPLSWEEARIQFEKDQLLSAVFGSNFVAKYLSVNKVLGDSLEQDEAEEAKVTRLVEFY
ncbi:hypothetical protein M378DRAFT_168822 [Amanita muscaria Koide BX008]|uniref:Glutamine synthetase n=1 Tax=Amanita muscaria (strain Koide BX008) TaxID=946122 RepID=A0A0C2WEJ6_AMAMK|nr:hypothetical protein M378DRAFT_168822 [Amanita muscaria Koide BX008]